MNEYDEIGVQVAHGVDVNSKEHDNSTALHAAAGRGHFAMVKFLVENGADVNSTQVMSSFKNNKLYYYYCTNDVLIKYISGRCNKCPVPECLRRKL